MRLVHLAWLLPLAACGWAGCTGATDPAAPPGGDPDASVVRPDARVDPSDASAPDATSDGPAPLDAARDVRVRDAALQDAAAAYAAIENLSDNALRAALLDLVDGHVSLGYDAARDAMFGITATFDVRSGNLECVYTGRLTPPNGTRTPGGFNTEHSWPQALGASQEPARSDLHHLFPTDDNANNARGNYPFGDTDCTTTCTYQNGGSKLGVRTGGTEIVFQVRPQRQGDIARAQFYFAVRYGLNIPPTVETTLKQWHAADPVDSVELSRNSGIEQLQLNRNPFVDRPDFVAKISDF
jgi:hypothetical protein